MTVKVLFFYEEKTRGFMWDWMCRICNYHDASAIVVDLPGHFSARSGHAYKTLDEALDAHKNFKLVWMDHRGDKILDEFEHPDGDVLYLTGHNIDGFGDRRLDGDIVRLRKPGQIWPLQVAYMALYDRELYLAGRRR